MLVCITNMLCRHYENQEDKTALKEAMTRLSLLIQNMHILIIHTKAQKFEDCTHQLFKRYMKTCNITGSTQRARSAWNALLRTGNALLLQDVDLCMLYIQTLLKHSADDDVSEDFFDDAVRCPPSVPTRMCSTTLLRGEYMHEYIQQPGLAWRGSRLGVDSAQLVVQVEPESWV